MKVEDGLKFYLSTSNILINIEGKIVQKLLPQRKNPRRKLITAGYVVLGDSNSIHAQIQVSQTQERGRTAHL